jgi:hypothetical protein
MPPFEGFEAVLPRKAEERNGTIYKISVLIQKNNPIRAAFQQKFEVFLLFFGHSDVILF